MNKEQKIEILTEVINTFDPEGLLGSGAPSDEYSPEIKDLAAYEIDTISLEELASAIHDVFYEWFMSNYKMEYCLKMATAIKAKLN